MDERSEKLIPLENSRKTGFRRPLPRALWRPEEPDLHTARPYPARAPRASPSGKIGPSHTVKRNREILARALQLGGVVPVRMDGERIGDGKGDVYGDGNRNGYLRVGGGGKGGNRSIPPTS